MPVLARSVVWPDAVGAHVTPKRGPMLAALLLCD
jgi:hypothetical protein